MRRKCNVSTSLDDKKYEEFRKYAFENGMTMSEAVRQLILIALKEWRKEKIGEKG